MGGLFKLFGTLVINGAEKAKKDIQSTGEAAEKASGVFEKVGSAIKKGFNDEKVQAFGVSLEKLNNRISGQHNTLELLKNKYVDLYLTQGKTSDEAQKVAAEIEKLSSDLNRNEQALEEAKSAADSFDKSLEKVGEESEESGKSILGSFLPVPPQLLKVATAAGAVVTAIVATGKKIVATADNTREYRLEMGKLETAFTTSGHSAESATETYQTLYSVLGETDRSVEASQHLARLCSTEEELKQWTDICIGAFASFDDSLPIEGLVEAANETAKTGQLTGVLADALNWAGVNEEDFQAKLNACTTEQERAAAITETMASLYGDVGDAYKENNADVIAATEAQEKLNAAMARWGEICEPIVTMFREGLAAAINFAADAFEFMIDPMGTAAEALAGTSATSAEAASKVEELRGKLAELADIPAVLWTSEHTKQQQELSWALEEAEKQYDQLVAAEERATQAAKTNATETKAAMADAVKVPVDAETPVSAYAEIMEGDSSMETAGVDAVERAGSSMQTAVASAGFDSAGRTGMQKFIDGINSMSGSVLAAVDNIASQAVARMQQAMDQIQNMASSASVNGSWETGLNYVPFDGYIAELHQGEAVLTAAEAAVWRAGKKSGVEEVQAPAQQTSSSTSGITIVQNINAVPQTPVEFAAATEAYFEQARWSMA